MSSGRDDRRETGTATAGSGVAAVLIAVVAIAAIALAVPSAMEAFVRIPGDPVLREVQFRRAVGADALARVVRSRERALEWSESPRALSDLALVLLLGALEGVARGEPTDEVRLAAAERLLVRSLARAPANANAWTRLAAARWHLGAPSGEVVGPLLASIEIAEVDPWLMYARLEIALSLWERFDDAGRQRVLEQIRLGWKVDPARLAATVRRAGRPWIARIALGRSRERLDELNRLLERAGSG